MSIPIYIKDDLYCKETEEKAISFLMSQKGKDLYKYTYGVTWIDHFQYTHTQTVIYILFNLASQEIDPDYTKLPLSETLKDSFKSYNIDEASYLKAVIKLKRMYDLRATIDFSKLHFVE